MAQRAPPEVQSWTVGAAGVRGPEVVAWAVTFAGTAWLLRGAFTGGSILGIGAVALAAAAATAAGAVVRALAAGSRPGAAAAAWRRAGRVVAGTSGALAGLCAALVTAVFAWGAFTGCFVHCDDADRSLPAGTGFAAVTVALATGAGWWLGWGLGVDGRTRRALAGGAGLIGVALVATAVAAAA